MKPVDPDAPTQPTNWVPTLPPIGHITDQDHALCCKILHDLAQESIDGRDNWIEQVDRNRTLYAYGADPPPDDDTLVLFDIQNAIIATTDIQTKEPPRCALEPVERGEPPVCYWQGPQDMGISMFQLAPEQVADYIDPQTGETVPPMPLNDQQADVIRNAIALGGVPIGPATVQPSPDGKGLVQGPPPMAPVKDDWFVEVNDQTVADVYQTIFDVYWTRSGMDRRVRENLLQTNVDGWTLWLYAFDEDEQKHILRETSPLQMYIDPSRTDISDAYSGGIEWVLKLANAKRMFPAFAAELENYATVGIPRRTDTLTQFGQADDRMVRGGTVTLRIFWIRDQVCPYTVEDAIERGLVIQSEVADGGFGQSDGVAGADRGTGTGSEELEGVVGESSGQGRSDSEPAESSGNDSGEDAANGDQPQNNPAEEATEGEEDLAHGPTNSDLVPAASTDGEGSGGIDGQGEGENPSSALQRNADTGIPLPTQTRYLDPSTGQTLTPPIPGQPLDENWPTYYCLREITQLGPGLIVDDRVCEHFDIPIIHNVNIPIPNRPWGIGEPYRLWKLVKARSRTMAAKVENSEYFGQPATSMSQAMADSLKERYGDVHIKPGRTMVVETDLYNELKGQIHTIIPPPPMPPSLVQLDEDLRAEIDRSSGYNEVLQGQPSSQVTSGKMLDSYQAAASSMIGFKSQRTGDAVERLGNLCLHSLVWRLDRDKFKRVVSKYKDWIVDAIIDRAHRVEWDVTVNVSSGTGGVLSRKRQEAQDSFKLGLASMETTQEASGLDPRQEKLRKAKEAKESMTGPGAGMVAPGQPNQPAAGASPNGQPQPSQNGNGQYAVGGPARMPMN